MEVTFEMMVAGVFKLGCTASSWAMVLAVQAINEAHQGGSVERKAQHTENPTA